MAVVKVPPVSGASRAALDAWGVEFLAQFAPETLMKPSQLDVRRIVDVVLPKYFDVESGVERLPSGVEGICEPPNTLLLSEDVYDGLETNPRARFTGAHEAAHAVLHLPQFTKSGTRYSSGREVRLYRRPDVPAYLDPEWQADRGAAALLMPAPMVWQLIDVYLSRGKSFVEVKFQEAFGVSAAAASIRLDDALNGRLGRP